MTDINFTAEIRDSAPTLVDESNHRSVWDLSLVHELDVRLLEPDKIVRLSAIRQKPVEEWERRRKVKSFLRLWVEVVEGCPAVILPQSLVYVEFEMLQSGSRTSWQVGQVLRQGTTAGLCPPPIPKNYATGTSSRDMLHFSHAQRRSE
jgi:hypothetical protein